MNRLNDLLNLTYVSRWGILSMRRQQTVAEHCHRTAVIAAELARRLDRPELIAAAVYWSMVHDASETYTGDTPSPLKDVFGRGAFHLAEYSFTPWLAEPPEGVKLIVKLADVIEAFTWWQKHGDVGMVHPWITIVDGLRAPMNASRGSVRKACDKVAADMGCIELTVATVATDIIGDILHGIRGSSTIERERKQKQSSAQVGGH